ncbi:family 43 glycosylhydrolase [Xanthocytophaga agilis]|uniref:Family 43 glycosylhydrolase n=1 Tax=Xanthocytophaga agilis TaxID=3048010 RepID=A0AAE3R0L5_9BACT|nr:family 43 glycosylhydrolase [Xanthocytophaga agilis]MDJ1501539.1 family 43 glycosylhydrolase [Xanthocytophaga agilis]
MFKRQICLMFCLCIYLYAHSQQTKTKGYSAYLFTYFTGSDEAIRYAVSSDGYHFKALNGGNPVLNSAKISGSGGVRDPHILRGAGGKTFYMVATDMNTVKNGWGPNQGIVLMRSKDLIDWESHPVDVAKIYTEYAASDRIWAPQTIFDPATGKYMIYWSMRLGKEDRDRIYYAYANKDFSALETKPAVLFDPPGNTVCIDADIIAKDGKYHLFFKHAGSATPGIKKAVSNKLTGGYVFQDKQLEQTKDEVEGSGIFKLNNSSDYILIYDVYRNGRYEFARSSDLEKFTAINADIQMDFHPRHGTVMPITTTEAISLTTRFLTPEQVIMSAESKDIKKNNTLLDTAAHVVTWQVKPGTDLTKFKPTFPEIAGVIVTPKGNTSFSKGTVSYVVKISGQQPITFTTKALETHNPVLDGLYADPDIIYAEKTGKYYIYPTSDGFTNWSGNYFNVFSSSDLVNWKDEGTILQLGKDVTWANTKAWAPAIVEKKINGHYQYFYYFCANGQIGVAVAENPTGPFKDLGKPLLDKLPEGATHGQQIDPDVFIDPVSGKSYLYWGNSYMAVAELAEDMTSLVPGTTKILTPTKTYNEGTFVFYRKGKYYFTWSEKDTRDPDYQVRYAVANNPMGPLTIPQDNLVIIKDTTAGIYATGHHSVIQIPGKDEWYIVYHRFNYPKGIGMGRSAGYNREVCIDKLEFREDGSILQTKPTHVGIEPVAK